MAGTSSICFSVIDSCSHFSPPAFRGALCSAELRQCLQPRSSLCLCSSCLCPAAGACPGHPGRRLRFPSSGCPARAVNRTGSWWGFSARFYSTKSCSCAASSSGAGKRWVCARVWLKCLQAALTQDEFLFPTCSPAAGNSSSPGWPFASLTGFSKVTRLS